MYFTEVKPAGDEVDLWGGVFYGSLTARGPSRNCSCRMGN